MLLFSTIKFPTKYFNMNNRKYYIWKIIIQNKLTALLEHTGGFNGWFTGLFANSGGGGNVVICDGWDFVTLVFVP